MNRRDFIACGVATCAVPPWAALFAQTVAAGTRHDAVGKALAPWEKGHFQIHFIYTGVAESMVWIMPDGPTMLLACGDHAAWMRGKKAVWVLPNGRKNAGEWVARYVARVNPAQNAVDYMMLSHHHSDHGGGEAWGEGIRRSPQGGLSACPDTCSGGRSSKILWRSPPLCRSPGICRL